jgi:hypothetical protein
LAVLVPVAERAAWRRQSFADLHAQREWLWASRASATAAEWDLLRRAAGASRHAAWLRWRQWRTNIVGQDLKYAIRTLTRRPGFATVIVLTLALGVGANATIFSWLDALAFNPIPAVAHASSLMAIHATTPTRHDLSLSYPNYRDVRDSRPAGIAGLIAFRSLALGMRVSSGEPERTWAEIVSGNYFDVLGVRPAAGRLLASTDDGAEGAGKVVVVSDRLWRSRFAGRADVAGTQVIINGFTFDVIGVAAPDFKGAVNGLAADMWLPLSMQRAVSAGTPLTDRGNGWLQVIARIKPGE